MGVVVVRPLPNISSRAVVRAIETAGLLRWLVTAVAVPGFLQKVVGFLPAIEKIINRRCFDDIPWRKIRLAPSREIVRLVAEALPLPGLAHAAKEWASVDAVTRDVDRRAARIVARSRDLRAVYAFEDGAAESFRAAHEIGAVGLYHLPIPHWRTVHRILREESELNPAWADTLEALADSPEKLARKDEELALADHVIVASAFSAESVLAFRSDVPVHVIPYGAPLPPLDRIAERRSKEPLRIVYVGQLRQRKGISYLFEAVRSLSIPFELTLIGARPRNPSAALREAVAQHRWLGKMVHADVLKVLRGQHVMVFPSLCEGFGLVILEAMGCGVPVITTPNTGGPHVIRDGVDGFIVPIRDPETIAARLTALYENEDRRQTMAAAARAAAEKRSWTLYERAIRDIVLKILGS